MHLKRYQRETVQEALLAVHLDLGPDALVLSTRTVPASGFRGWWGNRVVEVTAAAERLPASEGRHPLGVASRPDAATEGIVARLEATGVERNLAQAVAEAHPRDQRRGVSVLSLQRTLAQKLSELVAEDDGYAPVEVFVGPPGVGKTTTIAKIAAQERARRGVRLGLVAADGFRVGAVEQLRLYANILGSQLTVVRTPQELESALDSARRPLLLDTAGRAPSDDASSEMLRVLAGRDDVRTHLVLSADSPPQATRRALDRFACARPTRLVITKLDEAQTLAPIVSILHERLIPIAYLGTGQIVPDDLERATAKNLAGWVTSDYVGRGGAVA